MKCVDGEVLGIGPMLAIKLLIINHFQFRICCVIEDTYISDRLAAALAISLSDRCCIIGLGMSDLLALVTVCVVAVSCLDRDA